MFGGRHMRGLAQEAAKPIEVGRTLRRLLTYFRPFSASCCWRWLNNDLVTFVSSIVGSLMAGFLGWVVF